MTSDVPEFEVNIDDAGRVSFAHVGQARAYLRAKFAGQCIVAQFFQHQTQRSARQNRAGHALLSEWKRADERLQGWEIDRLKQWVLGRVFGWLEVVDIETGEVIKVLAEPHTSTLSVRKFGQFIDFILETAAEGGVFLPAPDEYLKAKARQRARDTKKGAAA